METASDKDFQEKVLAKSEKTPILVDFWAPWCMPCLMLAPVLEKLAKEHMERFILVKVNVDEAPATSKKYGIISIPAVKLFKKRKVANEFVGMLNEQAAEKWLNENL